MLLVACCAQAQFYSGNFISSPQTEDYSHFLIKQHPHHHKYGGELHVKAFIKHDHIWSADAQLLDEKESRKFIDTYGNGLEILSVYKLQVMLDGEDWEYFMLGYADGSRHGRFRVIEEIFDEEGQEKPVELNLFEWSRGHTPHN